MNYPGSQSMVIAGSLPGGLGVTSPPEISIVVPALNEHESLPVLHGELTQVLTSLGRSYEIVIVDDGSTDGTTELCRELARHDPHLVHIELRRCFGKATALQAGFRAARGEIIFTMDADLQDDPREIPRFLDMLEQGFDLVSGWKESRKDPITKTLPSKLFNYVTSRMSGLYLKDFNCGFKAYRREVIEDLDVYGELYRYIPVVVHAKGFRVGELPVAHRPRQYGASKYGMERFVRGPMDLFTILFLVSFRKRPLHLFGHIGVLISSLGVVINLYLAILWFQGVGIGSRPLLMLGTLLIIVGIQMLVFGLLGEMIAASSYNASEVDRLVRRVNPPPAA
jgi:glycosyltransferase involved in cell wall biosynthesis